MIPFPVCELFDVANMLWYMSDHDYKNALLSGMCALPMLSEVVGGGFTVLKMSKAAKFVTTSTKLISCGAAFTQTAGNTIKGIKNIYHNTQNGQFFTKQNAEEIAGVAVNAALTFFTEKATYKYGKELDVMLGGDRNNAWSRFKKQATTLHNNNGGYLKLEESGSETGIENLLNNRPELIGTTREKLLATIQDSELASIVNELYRPGATVGDGGTASILVQEFNNDSSKHLIKATQRLKQLKSLSSSRKLGLNDLDVVDELINDLENAIDLFN